MPLAPANGIDLWFETFGEDDDPALLLVAGLGAQGIIAWPGDLCLAFVDRGFRVVRFDNRDAGLSSSFGEVGPLPDPAGGLTYGLADMADDALGLLDHLGIGTAHVAGASMGAMIAQQLAITAGTRVATLTSIMSSTGESDVGQPHPEVSALLAEPPPTDRDAAVEAALRWSAATGSPEHRDPDRLAQDVAAAYDRAWRPHGARRQLAAVAAAEPHDEGLRALTVPTLVIHGTEDRVIDPSGGHRTAELVPGARLELIEGLGHDLPVYFWSRVVELVTGLAAAAATP